MRNIPHKRDSVALHMRRKVSNILTYFCVSLFRRKILLFVLKGPLKEPSSSLNYRGKYNLFSF